jgi:OPA family glycerol-3-phosphate transporter-like MFS transporter
MAIVMAATLSSSPLIFGYVSLIIFMASVGTASLMAGTAATDFGGRKAAATCSGIVDGCTYLGSGIQSFSLGYLTTWNWHYWPYFLMPFALIGMLIAIKIWHDLPVTTRKYLAEAG